MEKKIKIGDKEILFKASAALPLKYKNIFHGEMIQRLMTLSEDNIDILFVEEVAYVMSGAHSEGVTFEDWLEQFDFYELVEALGDIITLITENTNTTALVDGTEKNVEAIEN